jgi:hypothetical protein
VTLFLHNVERLADLAELHFILSFWSIDADNEHLLAGWVMSQLEPTPDDATIPESELKIRHLPERKTQRRTLGSPLPAHNNCQDCRFGPDSILAAPRNG